MIATRVLLAAALVAWLSHQAAACSVPVFRYALERWSPSPYTALVAHTSPLTPDELKLVEAMNEQGFDRQGVINLQVKIQSFADGEKIDEDIKKLVSSPPKSPEIVLLGEDPQSPVCRLPLNPASVSSLLDSPARREVARRILSGETAVWVVLRGAEAKENAALEALLTEECRLAPTKLTLPEQDPVDPADAADAGPRIREGGPPLKIAASILPIDRSDPREAVFIANLLAVPREAGADSAALAIPIFGRGRALGSLRASAIKPAVFLDAMAFLAGPCSCQVKEQNPGTDVLMLADWETSFSSGKLSDIKLPPLTGLVQFAVPAKPAGPATLAVPPARPNSLRRLVIIGAAALALVLVISLVLLKRK